MIQLKDHVLNGCRVSKVHVKQHKHKIQHFRIFRAKQGCSNNLF